MLKLKLETTNRFSVKVTVSRSGYSQQWDFLKTFVSLLCVKTDLVNNS